MWRRSHRRPRDEAGEISVLLVFPLTVLSILLCVHAALVFHGRSVVAGAAQDGLRAAQIENGSREQALNAATRLLALAPALHNRKVQVSYSDDDDTITVVVSADVSSVIPGLLNDARSVATGPRERFYGENERQ